MINDPNCPITEKSVDQQSYAKAVAAESETEARQDAIDDQIEAAITARRRARDAEDLDEINRLSEEIARLQRTKDDVWVKPRPT